MSLSNTTQVPIETMITIPEEMQIPIAVAIGVLGLLIALGFVLQSSGDSKKSVVIEESTGSSPKSPAPSTPMSKKTGSVLTPAGRRSARIARRRKEE